MNPEDLPDPGTYIDPLTGDIWKKYQNGQWYVNGLLHKPFPITLVPEQYHEDSPQDRRLRDTNGYSE